MRPSARVSAIIEAMNEIASTPKPADVILGQFFRNRRYIGSSDRMAIAEPVYELLRHHARIGWWLEKYNMVGTPRNRLIMWLMLSGNTVKEVTDAFSGDQYAPNPLTPAELALLDAMQSRTLIHPDMPETVQLECPAWAEEGLRSSLGNSFFNELRALTEAAPVDLRINALKTKREDVQKMLLEEGIETEPTSHSTLGLRVKGRPALGATQAFQDGLIEVQDEGSQLVADLVDAKPGMQIVDFCAGAGGKTMPIAAAMKNKGRLIACDVHEGRLKRATLRFRRAGLHNIETRVLSTESDPWVKRHKGKFDAVLVDAPCSGTGVWRRNPDARWRPLGPGLGDLMPLQTRILASAARLVKPGGKLVYATCSLLDGENKDQIAKFLATTTEFEEVKSMALRPARDGTDGFFASVLVRKASAPQQEPAKAE